MLPWNGFNLNWFKLTQKESARTVLLGRNWLDYNLYMVSRNYRNQRKTYGKDPSHIGLNLPPPSSTLLVFSRGRYVNLGCVTHPQSTDWQTWSVACLVRCRMWQWSPSHCSSQHCLLTSISVAQRHCTCLNIACM